MDTKHNMRHIQVTMASGFPYLKPWASTFFRMVNPKDIADPEMKKRYYLVWKGLNTNKNADDIDFMFFSWCSDRAFGRMRERKTRARNEMRPETCQM